MPTMSVAEKVKLLKYTRADITLSLKKETTQQHWTEPNAYAANREIFFSYHFGPYNHHTELAVLEFKVCVVQKNARS